MIDPLNDPFETDKSENSSYTDKLVEERLELCRKHALKSLKQYRDHCASRSDAQLLMEADLIVLATFISNNKDIDPTILDATIRILKDNIPSDLASKFKILAQIQQLLNAI